MKGLKTQNPADEGDDQLSIKIPSLVLASQDAAAAANEGNIFYDETNDVVKFSDGATWAAITSGAATLDDILTNGAASDVASVTLTGAASAATALAVGDATDAIEMYALAGAVYLVSTGASDLTIEPDGGNINLVGATDVDGVFTCDLTAAQILVGSGAGEAVDVAVSGVIALANDGTTSYAANVACPTRPVVDTAAGTLTLAGQTVDTINTISTNAAADCVVTLDATAAVGQEITFAFVTDGGFDVVVNCGGADVFWSAGGIVETGATMEDAGDFLIVRKVMPDVWLVVSERGNTIA